MANNEHIIAANDLHKTFGKGPAAVHVLRGLGLRVRRGEFLAVMGPSGCGKSTLLHVLGLMTPPESGTLELLGEPAPADEGGRQRMCVRNIGFVFQRFNLLGELSAADNVAVSLRVRGTADDGRANELFRMLGIAHLKGRKPGAMSIGEQQRVAVVRAMAHRPALLLADEPTGNLDSANAEELLSLLHDMNRTAGQTIVMITHSADAAACADRVAHMKDGKILDPVA